MISSLRSRTARWGEVLRGRVQLELRECATGVNEQLLVRELPNGHGVGTHEAVVDIVHADGREGFHAMLVGEIHDQLQGAVTGLRQGLDVGRHARPVVHRPAVRVAVDGLDLAVVSGGIKLPTQHGPGDRVHLGAHQGRNAVAEKSFRRVGVRLRQVVRVIVEDDASPRPSGGNARPFCFRPARVGHHSSGLPSGRRPVVRCNSGLPIGPPLRRGTRGNH